MGYIWSGVAERTFEDVASSLREEYPGVTDEQLERAVTVHDDGYTIHEHELPEKPFAEKLEKLQQVGMKGVEVLSQRAKGMCDVCRSDDGTYYSIKKAIRTQPLPHAGCTCPGDLRRETGARGCTYMPRL